MRGGRGEVWAQWGRAVGGRGGGGRGPAWRWGSSTLGSGGSSLPSYEGALIPFLGTQSETCHQGTVTTTHSPLSPQAEPLGFVGKFILISEKIGFFLGGVSVESGCQGQERREDVC